MGLIVLSSKRVNWAFVMVTFSGGGINLAINIRINARKETINSGGREAVKAVFLDALAFTKCKVFFFLIFSTLCFSS